MKYFFSKWDLFHLLGTSILMMEKWFTLTPNRIFVGFMVLLQLVWIAGLMTSRGLTTPLSREYLGAIRGLLSFAVAVLFLFLMGGEAQGMLLLCSLLGFSALSLAIVFSVRASQEQARLSPPGGAKEYLIFYANKNDPRVVVPRGSFGVCITLNFARPESWLVIILLVVAPLVVSAFLKYPRH